MTDFKKIKYDQFIDSDKKPINEVLGAFDTLDKGFKDLADSIKNESKKVQDSIDGIADSTRNLQKDLGKINPDFGNSAQQIDEISKKLNENKDNIENLRKAKKQLSAVEKELEKEQKKQERLLARNNEQVSKQALETEKLSQKVAENTRQRKRQAQIENERSKSGTQDIKITEAQTNSVNELTSVIGLNINEYNKLSKEQRENTIEGQKLLKTIQQQRAELSKVKKEYGDTRDNVGNYKDDVKAALAETGLFNQALGTSGEGFTLLKSGLATAVKGLGSFKTALISTGIGAIIVAIGAIFVALTQTSEGFEKFRRISGGVGQVLNLVVGVIGKVGNAILNIKKTITETDIPGTLKTLGKNVLEILKNAFIDPFAGFGEILAGVFTLDIEKISSGFDRATTLLQKGFNFIKTTATNAGTEIKKAFDLGAELADIVIENEKLNRVLEVQIVQTAALAQLRRDQQDDDKKGFEERLKFAEQSEALIRKRFALELKVQQNNLKAINKEIELRKSNGLVINEQLDAQKEVLKELSQLEGDFTQDLRDQIELRSTLLTDQFELELDTTEKINAVKLANLAEIAQDEKKTDKERAQALEDYKNLSNATFEEAKKGAVLALTEIRNQQLKASQAEKEAFEATLKARGLINKEGEITGKLTKDEIARYAEINKNIADQTELLKQGFDIQKLLNAETSEQFQAEIKNQDIIEKGAIRILDLWVQRQEQIKTTADIEKESNKEVVLSAEEKARKEIDLFKQIQQFRKLTSEEAATLADAQLRKDKELLDKKLITEEEFNKKRAEIIASATQANIEQESKYREFLQSPVTSTLIQESAKQIENEIIRAGILAYTNALQQGKTQSEASKAGFQALASAQIIKTFAKTAKKDGGTVMGGEGLVWMNEEGHEFVVDAPTTKALGLHNNATMSDFHNKVNAISNDSYMQAMAEIAKKSMELQQNIAVNFPTAKQIGKEVGNNLPYGVVNQMESGIKLVIQSETRKLKTVTFKDRKRHL